MVGGWRNKFESQPESEPEDKFSDLLVFGYHCKLFRNDDQARYVDQNKHLIPWMGDESITIDRYDGRGLLHDLRPHEAPTGGYDRFENMTNEEKKVELLCDEERYLALTTDLNEEKIRQEEEWKRLRLGMDADSTYHEVSFSYDQAEIGPQPPDEAEKEAMSQEDPELLQPYVPPPQLDLPADIALPSNMKIHKIIEKTARFIATQGMQMEVVIKAKQAKNPYFGFLSFDSTLYAYYRFILQSIRSGKYHPPPEQEEEEQQQEDDDTDGDDQYLHPLLSSTLTLSKPDLAPSIPSINYKPSDDCSYAKLVSQIKSKVIPPPVALATPEPPANESPVPPPPPIADQTSVSIDLKAPLLVTPPPDQQLIIDKMASYVAKNGRDFETIVQSKGDSRFSFLEPLHCYHKYYQHKLSLYQGLDIPSPPVVPQPPLPPKESGETKPVANICAIPAVVSFCIKSREAETAPLEKSALPAEDTDEEEKQETKESDADDLQREDSHPDTPPVAGIANGPTGNIPTLQSVVKIVSDVTDSNPQVEDSPPSSPPLTTLDKCMQLERKRKALAFLNRIQLGRKTTEPAAISHTEGESSLPEGLTEKSSSPGSPLEPGQIETAEGSAIEAENIQETRENGKSERSKSDTKKRKVESKIIRKSSRDDVRTSDSEYEVVKRKYSRNNRRSKRKRRRSRSRDRSHRKHHRSKYRRRSSSSSGRKRRRSSSSGSLPSSTSSDRSVEYHTSSKHRKHSRHKSSVKKSRRHRSKSPERSRHRRKSRHRGRSARARSSSASSTRSHSVVILSDGSYEKERSLNAGSQLSSGANKIQSES